MVRIFGEDSSQCPTYEDIMKLTYLESVLKECLRMYPAAPIIGRKVTEEIRVIDTKGKEYIFPAGKFELSRDILALVINFYSSTRHPILIIFV